MRDHDTGNAGAKNQFQGLPKLTIASLGTMTNGTTETVEYLDDAETGWTAINTRVVASSDTDTYRAGASSLKLAFAVDAVAADGAIGTIGANDDLSANESIGFWIYSSEKLRSGDFYIEIVDGTSVTDYTVDVPAISAKRWTWVECDISACEGGGADCDAVTDLNFKISTTGAANLGAVDIYLDSMWKWDAADEETLGKNIISDGVLKVLSITTANGQPNTIDALTEYTDYFTHYQTGDDAIVTISDQSAESGIALIAHQ